MRSQRTNSCRRLARAVVLAAVVAFGAGSTTVACSGTEEEASNNDNNSKPPIRRPPPRQKEWTLYTVHGAETDELAVGANDEVGLHVKMAKLGDGDVGIAYFSTEHVVEGDCAEVAAEGQPPEDQLVWPLYFASGADDAWTVEEVARQHYVSEPPGLDLRTGPDGTPYLAAMIGESSLTYRYCGANDAGYYRRTAPGNWEPEIVVERSDQARAPADSPSPAASDSGEVVGLWPGLYFDRNGQPAVVYQDVHGGSLQGDDRRRADLEMAWQKGGSWEYIPVDAGRGAGQFNEVRFDPDNTPYIAYFNSTENLTEVRLGIWVARQVEGSNWERVQIFNRATKNGPDVLFHPTSGQLHLVYFESSRGFPELGTLVNPEEFLSVDAGWDFQDIGDSRYDEGYNTSLAVSPDGRLAVAYYRCVNSSTGSPGECDSADDALVFAYEEEAGGVWEREVVDPGEDGFCGLSPTLEFDATEEPVIAYRCQRLFENQLISEVKFARREVLP